MTGRVLTEDRDGWCAKRSRVKKACEGMGGRDLEVERTAHRRSINTTVQDNNEWQAA